MNPQVFSLKSASEAEVKDVASKIGTSLRGGEVIELIGDVGSGKTSFTRWLVEGAGSADRVTSPTFTVSNVYTTNNLLIHHYDFYRLSDLEVIRNELAENLEDTRSVIVLEWANSVSEVLPKNHITITFRVSGEFSRDIEIKIPKDYEYLEIR